MLHTLQEQVGSSEYNDGILELLRAHFRNFFRRHNNNWTNFLHGMDARLINRLLYQTDRIDFVMITNRDPTA